MALWICRAGKLGEHETRFVEDNRIYCTWDEVQWDMSAVSTREQFRKKLFETYPAISNERIIGNWLSQLWSFSHGMKIGDYVALPSKIKPTVLIGSIVGGYQFDPNAAMPYQHFHEVQWKKELLRSNFDQDLLYSLGSAMSICQIERNDAENRILKMVNAAIVDTLHPISTVVTEEIDLEENALQEIADHIIRKCKGHDMARLVAAILQAKGYTTYISPPGPDKGVDILASQGSLGFGSPRICVQVKSGADPVDRPTLDQLIGAMSNHKAEFGLLVSWGGFRNSVISEMANQFFKVRLWTHKEVLQEFIAHYESLPEDIRELIPLKRIWIIDKRID